MSRLLICSMGLAATLFVMLSATINAMFLSSLGRTAFEANVLGAISIAADIAKAALPVVILRAIVVRAWVHVVCASVMLLIVVALSLTSGIGFAAVTRGTVTATRQAQSDDIAARQRTIVDLEAQLERISNTRPVSVIEADIAASMIDWRWNASKSCREIVGSSVRQFCAGIFKLKTEQATALERQRLSTEQVQLRDRVGAIRLTGGVTDSDPQASAIAEILGVHPSVPRLLLTTFTAVMIELGSVVLIVLIGGPALNGWRDQKGEQDKPQKQVTIPSSKDVDQWRQRHNTANLLQGRSGSHG